MAWWMFKPLTILPAERSLASGHARKTGLRKGGSAPATMNFWNGANGSRRRSRDIAQRDLMFRLSAYELGNAGCDWPTGDRARWNSFSYLFRRSNERANERAAAVGRKCPHRAVGRPDLRPSRERGVQRNLSARPSVFQ